MNTTTSTSEQTSPRIALITGGSRGLGKNTALHLARDGVGIILTYVGNRSAAETTVAELQALGVRAVALQLNLADSASFPAFAQAVRVALQDAASVSSLSAARSSSLHGRCCASSQISIGACCGATPSGSKKLTLWCRSA